MQPRFKLLRCEVPIDFEILMANCSDKDATDALDGQSLISAVDFKHSTRNIIISCHCEVGLTYPSYFVDEDKYYLYSRPYS